MSSLSDYMIDKEEDYQKNLDQIFEELDREQAEQKYCVALVKHLKHLLNKSHE